MKDKRKKVEVAKIFIPKNEIYEAYVDKIDDYNEFRELVKSHIKFIQKLSRDALKEKDILKLNGVINHCESFLIRNHLTELENNKENEL